jgi:hypothetical protein
METVNFLAELWGFLLIIIGLSFLINPKHVKTIFHLIEDEKNVLLIGLINAVAGILLILTYNIWDSTWHVLISLLGWLVLVRGAFILFLPNQTQKIVEKVRSKMNLVPIILVVCVLLGCVLIYLGQNF